MNIIIILIAISLTLALVFLTIFFWCMKSGQYDDTYTPAVRMLFENKAPKEKNPGSSDVKGQSGRASEVKRRAGNEEGQGSLPSTRARLDESSLL
ncbi:MAG TPA: cbb3-type cytochrome oxidase assembly protein CcoS [Chryseosolibacter sp.]